MGRRHARAGVLGAVATLPVALAGPDAAVPVGLWAAGWVAGSMAPDFDAGGSHPARVWGAPSRLVATGVGWLAGGHRESTHDIVLAPLTVGAALAVLLSGAGWLAGVSPWLGVAALLVLALPFGFALRMLAEVRRWRVFADPLPNFAVSLACAGWLLASPGRVWFAVAVAAGMAGHILGDSITNEGAPVSRVWVWGERLLRVDNAKTRKDWRSRQWGLRLWPVGSAEEEAMGPLMVGAAWVFGAGYAALSIKYGWPFDLPAPVSLTMPGGGVPSMPVDVPGAPDIGFPDLRGWADDVTARLWDAAADAARKLLG